MFITGNFGQHNVSDTDHFSNSLNFVNVVLLKDHFLQTLDRDDRFLRLTMSHGYLPTNRVYFPRPSRLLVLDLVTRRRDGLRCKGTIIRICIGLYLKYRSH